MTKIYNGTPVPRHFLITTTKGMILAQLTANRGQDLTTGKIVEWEGQISGAPVADYELEHLKIAGVIEHYDQTYAWVHGLPEPHQYDPTLGDDSIHTGRERWYYLNTWLGGEDLGRVQELLAGRDIGVAEWNGHVILRRTDGSLIEDSNEAETLQLRLEAEFPDILGNVAVAFVEIDPQTYQPVHEFSAGGADSNLSLIISSQTDVSITAGKHVLLTTTVEEDRLFFVDLCKELHIELEQCSSGFEALERLEDHTYDLFILDLKLSDIHGWEMISKLREVNRLRRLPVIVISEGRSASDQYLSMAVDQVDVFLVKPLSRARVRQNIWLALKG